jgi:hypothetical protein
MMLSSLLRPKRGHRRASAKPLLFKGFRAFRNSSPPGEDTASEEEESGYDHADECDEDESAGEVEVAQPILPIFSAPVLGMFWEGLPSSGGIKFAHIAFSQTRYPYIICRIAFAS